MSLPIPIPMAVAVYFTMWWTVLFAILPFGVKSQHESGEIVPGSEPGAPVAPGLVRKAIWTTVASAALFVGLIAVLAWFPEA